MNRDQMIRDLSKLGADTAVIDYGTSEDLLAEWLRSLLMHTHARDRARGEFQEVGGKTRSISRAARGNSKTASYGEVQRLERIHDHGELGLKQRGVSKARLIKNFERYKQAHRDATVDGYLHRLRSLQAR